MVRDKKTDPKEAIELLLAYKKSYEEVKEASEDEENKNRRRRFFHSPLLKVQYFCGEISDCSCRDWDDPGPYKFQNIFLDEEDWAYLFNKYKKKLLEEKGKIIEEEVKDGLRGMEDNLKEVTEFFNEIENINEF